MKRKQTNIHGDVGVGSEGWRGGGGGSWYDDGRGAGLMAPRLDRLTAFRGSFSVQMTWFSGSLQRSAAQRLS